MLAITPDGRYLYVGDVDLNRINILQRVYTGDGPFEDTGWRIPLGYPPWQMIVSPDGKYLVVTDSRIFDTFAIQDDGNLVYTGYRFNFELVFGIDPQYFQFAYPEAPTGVEKQEWQLYQ